MKKIKIDVVMALAMNAVLVLLLLPMLYCSTADVATGDDLLNGAVVYHVLQDGGRRLYCRELSHLAGNLVLHFSLLFCPGELGQGDVCDRAVDRDFHRAGGSLAADAGISGQEGTATRVALLVALCTYRNLFDTVCAKAQSGIFLVYLCGAL